MSDTDVWLLGSSITMSTMVLSSGAVQTVINALKVHYNSQSIQECGLKAPVNQCVYSKNADSNKLAFVESNVILSVLSKTKLSESTVAE
jgi:hypothetical protein